MSESSTSEDAPWLRSKTFMQLFNLAPTDWRIYESTGMNDKNPNWKSMINMETLILTKDIEK